MKAMAFAAPTDVWRCRAPLVGKLRVFGDLPAMLAHGLFARPETYPLVLRFSTNLGDILNDSISAPRSLALKVIGVEGERLPGSEGEATQDFVMVDARAFAASNIAAFADSPARLAASTDTGQGWKKAFSVTACAAETALESLSLRSPTLVNRGSQPQVHPLGEIFYTQMPLRYGDYAAKLSLAPVSASLSLLTGAPLDMSHRPNGLHEAVIDFFRTHSAEWELRVQLDTHSETMPIEGAWPEDESPYRPVARVTVPRQPTWIEAGGRWVDDDLAFSPWNGLSAHRPLGAISRAPKPA